MSSQDDERVEIVHDDESSMGGSWFVTALTLVASLLTILPFLSGLFTSAAAIGMAPPPVPPGYIAPPPHSNYYDLHSYGEPCILTHNDISAKVSGYVAHVTVRQRFSNPNARRIDATYMFPLSDSAAVDEMTMKIGNRTIKGSIHRTEEARAIYNQAMEAGATASLLEQKRTNIFSQSVTNVEAGKPIDITIDYTEPLPFRDGQFSLNFPTSIGPRFIPAGMAGQDVSAGQTSGQNVASSLVPESVSVAIDEGGLPISNITSPNHQLSIHQSDWSHATVSLKDLTARAGDDVVLNFQAAANELETGCLTHKDGKYGFLTAMVLPPKKVLAQAAAPKEMIFIVDTSGSQEGAPLDKAKDTMRYILQHMNPDDTFQIVGFASQLSKFPEKPTKNTPETKAAALRFINGLTAGGGTIMAPAIEAVCALPTTTHRLRLVTIMTDGFIGDDYQVLGMVQRLRGKSRWFAFGTGNNVNHTIIDGIAREGGGEADYIMLDSPSEQIAEKFYEKISSPVLTNVSIRAEGFEMHDVYPKRVSDVWEQRPLYFQARYEHGGKGTLIISGFAQGKPYISRVPVVLPDRQTEHGSVAQLWARARIDDLMSTDWNAMQKNESNSDAAVQIINTSLEYHVLSQFTSFVAVDSASLTDRKAAEKEPTLSDIDKSQLQLPEWNSHSEMSPTNITLGLGAVGATGWLMTRFRPTPVLVVASVGVGAMAVFGFAKGALQSTLSESFSTTVSQLNALNSYSSGAGDGYRSSVQGYPATDAFATSGTDNSGFVGTNDHGGNTYAQTTNAGNLTPVQPPNLQGATNGTLGPQISDATVITGANTSGQIASSGILVALPNHHASVPQAPAGAGVTYHGAINTRLAAAAPVTPVVSGASTGNTESKMVYYDPYTLHLGSLTIDLQVAAVLFQWVWFLLACFVVTPLLYKKAVPHRWQKVALTGAFLFVSLNASNTMHWLMQCAHTMNLV